jgi:hypothetical protein
MNENRPSNLTSFHIKNSNDSNQQIREVTHEIINNNFPNNINDINSYNKEKEEEELDDIDNLRYKDEYNNNNYPMQRLDSSDSPLKAPFKFSIDLPNVSKQRLHEYLNDDLLNALEISPSIPNLNNGIQNMKINENDKLNTKNNNNNPNSLMGFSLYPTNIENTPNNNNLNMISDYNIHQNPPNIHMANNMNNNNINNINNMNNINIINTYNLNNINNYNNNYNNNNMINSNLNLDNQPMYIPPQMRNNDQKMKMEKNNGNNNNKYQSNRDEKNKNKYEGKKNLKKEGKSKKPFEVRAGDWNCTKCSNLNFSFRSKCNRCGLPKEMSEQGSIPPEMIYNQNNQNINYQMMGNINPNYAYLNNRNDINEMQYYQKK